jgi:hypothetical protein
MDNPKFVGCWERYLQNVSLHFQSFYHCSSSFFRVGSNCSAKLNRSCSRTCCQQVGCWDPNRPWFRSNEPVLPHCRKRKTERDRPTVFSAEKEQHVRKLQGMCPCIVAVPCNIRVLDHGQRLNICPLKRRTFQHFFEEQRVISGTVN